MGRPSIEREAARERLSSGIAAERRGRDHVSHIVGSSISRRYQLEEQFRLQRQGDIARRQDLHRRLHQSGGWRKQRTSGVVSQFYVDVHFGGRYLGPSIYPRRCWIPHWRPWVEWCWWDYCYEPFDPRPIICRPRLYDPCPVWIYRSYTVWRPLPVVECGTWVDVPVVEVPPTQYDLQLLAVRFVDPGHPEQQLGPRYRIWFRNTSDQAIDGGFNVLLLAGSEARPRKGDVEAGVRVPRIEAGEIQTVDIRLPFVAPEAGGPAADPFSHLHVVVDSHGEVTEAFTDNNGASLPIGDILPVDPVLFSAEREAVSAGESVAIAGEGLGPEPGKVLVFVKGLELQAEIEGWFDLGVRIRVPDLPVADDTPLDLVVVRGDGAATNPLPLNLVPAPPELLPPLP